MKHVCSICGKEFESKSHNAKVCNECKIGKCVICGKEFVRDWPYTQKTCKDNKCRMEYIRRETSGKLKICPLCGKEFHPVSPRQKYCNDDHYRKCVVCGKKFKLSSANSKAVTCNSTHCKSIIRNKTNLSRYGVENAMQNDEIKQRMSNTVQNRYHADWYFQTDEFWNKYRTTMLEHHGVKNSLNSYEISKKFKETMIQRYGAAYSMCSDTIRSKIESTMQDKYGVPYYVMTDDYHKYQRNLISHANKEFARLLNNHGISVEFEKRISNRSYDICIEDKKILVEINPTITHNSVFSIYDKSSNGLDSKYHLYKTELAESYGYRCIHVFDWDDWDKIIDVIVDKQSIYARKHHVVNLPSIETKKFEDENHLQGSCKGETVRLGLVDDKNQLYQIMTFGNPRYTSRYQFELLRLCSMSNYAVIGGANKLFSYFINKYNPKSIISYCDRSKFSGYIYKKLGFVLSHNSPTAKVWSKSDKHITDNLLRQRGYDQLFKTNYGIGSNNEKLMLDSGWLPVYDCGQAVYEWKDE